jgi:hypothetical protein
VGAAGSIAKSSQINLSAQTSKFDVTQATAGYVIPAAQRVLGSGDWDGRIVLDGTLAPGSNGIGILTGDDLTFDGAGVMQFELGASDNSSDLLTLSGSFERGTAGAFRFDFANTGANGRTYTLVQFLSTTFAASNFSFVNLAPGLTGSFSITPTELRFVVIPEPSTSLAALAGMGLAGLWLRRRR